MIQSTETNYGISWDKWDQRQIVRMYVKCTVKLGEECGKNNKQLERVQMTVIQNFLLQL